jgi:alkanesulfonate monooxygenase SsuD/methylene tetrahydromethanopterin reductase-like flavin-dependent oxidoreductase (luciferase family)
MHNANRLKIGLFGMNCSSAVAMTTVAERWPATWEENLAAARLADEAGIDFLLPVGRWKGYGGATDFEGTSFETVTWASALLAATRRITIFGTVHAPMFHPIIAAKQMVTADHVGSGRFGLNVVAGWNEDEFIMFGMAQRDHQARYEHAQEWLDAVKMMWERDDFDFDGRFIRLNGVRTKPKPYGGSRPIIMNAGRSADGEAFALRNCDAFFTGLRTMQFDERSGIITPNMDEAVAQVRRVRAVAAAQGRHIGVFTRAEVICRPTQQEALEYYRYAYEQHADWDAVEHELRVQLGLTPESADWERLRKLRTRRFPLIGDPDTVVRLLSEISAAEFDGVAISLVNYLDELPYVCSEVLPRLERAGLRQPASIAV